MDKVALKSDSVGGFTVQVPEIWTVETEILKRHS